MNTVFFFFHIIHVAMRPKFFNHNSSYSVLCMSDVSAVSAASAQLQQWLWLRQWAKTEKPAQWTWCWGSGRWRHSAEPRPYPPSSFCLWPGREKWWNPQAKPSFEIPRKVWPDNLQWWFMTKSSETHLDREDESCQSQATDVGVRKADDGPDEMVLGRLGRDVHYCAWIWSSGRPSGEAFAGPKHRNCVQGLPGWVHRHWLRGFQKDALELRWSKEVLSSRYQCRFMGGGEANWEPTTQKWN